MRAVCPSDQADRVYKTPKKNSQGQTAKPHKNTICFIRWQCIDEDKARATVTTSWINVLILINLLWPFDGLDPHVVLFCLVAFVEENICRSVPEVQTARRNTRCSPRREDPWDRGNEERQSEQKLNLSCDPGIPMIETFQKRGGWLMRSPVCTLWTRKNICQNCYLPKMHVPGINSAEFGLCMCI